MLRGIVPWLKISAPAASNQRKTPYFNPLYGMINDNTQRSTSTKGLPDQSYALWSWLLFAECMIISSHRFSGGLDGMNLEGTLDL